MPNMPHFSDTQTASLTISQANQSQLVTKNLYVVEVLNVRLKKTFQYFEKIIRNTTIPYMFKDFRIPCALLNMTSKPPTTSEMGELIILKILSFSNTDNVLSLLVQ